MTEDLTETCGACNRMFPTLGKVFSHPCEGSAPTRRFGGALPLHSRPQAGSATSNQFGTFTVHYATEKQTKFISSLLDRKDLSKLDNVETIREQVADNRVNKKVASTLIETLLALPDVQTEPATEKQIAFLKKLAAERPMWADVENLHPDVIERMTKAQAKNKIDDALQISVERYNPTDIEAGVYTNNTDTFRVYTGQQSGQMLAARVIQHENGRAEFEYVGKASRFITAAFRKLTIEEAARFGKATGTCIVCARRLDVPESVDRGIGPVCYSKMGG